MDYACRPERVAADAFAVRILLASVMQVLAFRKADPAGRGRFKMLIIILLMPDKRNRTGRQLLCSRLIR